MIRKLKRCSAEKSKAEHHFFNLTSKVRYYFFAIFIIHESASFVKSLLIIIPTFYRITSFRIQYKSLHIHLCNRQPFLFVEIIRHQHEKPGCQPGKNRKTGGNRNDHCGKCTVQPGLSGCEGQAPVRDSIRHYFPYGRV